jgi:hypothetical protein
MMQSTVLPSSISRSWIAYQFGPRIECRMHLHNNKSSILVSYSSAILFCEKEKGQEKNAL